MSINRIIPGRHISLPDFDLFGHALNSLPHSFSLVSPIFPPWHDFPTLRPKKKKKYLRSGALFELIKFERLLRLSEASISRCSSDRKRKIADGAVNMPVKFSVITRNWPRNRNASAVQRTCFLNN